MMDTPALAGVIVACVVGMGLLCWLSMLCRMFFFYEMPDGAAPRQAFSADQDDCCTMACIQCNEAILQQCCPHLHYERPLYNPNTLDTSLNGGNTNGFGLMPFAAGAMAADMV